MSSEILKRDSNNEPVAGFVTDDVAKEIRMARIDDTSKGLKIMLVGGTGSGDVVGPASATDGHIAVFDGATGKLIKDGGASAGTVTTVSVATANGFSGTVANATTTPAITIIAGAITPTSVNGLTLASQAIGFTIAGGTTSQTLTVPLNASVSGINTGDNAANSTYTIGSQTQAYNSNLTDINQALTTTSSPSFTTVTANLTGNASGTSANVTGIVAPANGGTGIANNAAMTVTGVGNYAYTRTLTNTTNVTFPTTGTLATRAGVETFTNKRITPRILSAASYTTDTGTSIAGDSLDMFIVTAQAGDLKFKNPSGTPTDGQKLIISVASSTTAARALTWDTAYGSTTVALPTTTAATTVTLTMGFIWSASKSLWQCVAVA